MSCNSIFTEIVVEWINALVAVFETYIEMSPDDSKYRTPSVSAPSSVSMPYRLVRPPFYENSLIVRPLE